MVTSRVLQSDCYKGEIHKNMQKMQSTKKFSRSIVFFLSSFFLPSRSSTVLRLVSWIQRFEISRAQLAQGCFYLKKLPQCGPETTKNRVMCCQLIEGYRHFEHCVAVKITFVGGLNQESITACAWCLLCFGWIRFIRFRTIERRKDWERRRERRKECERERRVREMVTLDIISLFYAYKKNKKKTNRQQSK